MHDEVRILIFDDPAKQERGQRPEFRSAQLYSTRVYTTVDLNLDAIATFDCMLMRLSPSYEGPVGLHPIFRVTFVSGSG